MRGLLTDTENRRYDFLNILIDRADWVTLAEISKQLNFSDRVLREDIVYLRENFDIFMIQTSKKGVRIKIKSNEGKMTIAQIFIAQSQAFQLIEYIFFSENESVADVSFNTFQSTSTVYRLINHINNVFEKQKFKIETSPVRIVGDEQSIRTFFYIFFTEKYSFLEFPFKNIDEEALDTVLEFFLKLSQMEADFAFYNTYKIVSCVNIVRYKQGFHIDSSLVKSNFSEIVPDLTLYTEALAPYEEKLNLRVDNHFVEQVWPQYIDESFSLDYDRLKEKYDKNLDTKNMIDYLDDGFSTLANKFNLKLENKTSLIIHFMNKLFLYDKEGAAGHMLFDRHEYFYIECKQYYSEFSDYLLNFIENFMAFVGKQLPKTIIYYFFYVAFAGRKDLISQLRHKSYVVKILIITERHNSHANMLKDFFRHEITDLIEIDIYYARHIDENSLLQSDYDFFISDFPTNRRFQDHIYIEGIPTSIDVNKVQNKIVEIIHGRLQKQQDD